MFYTAKLQQKHWLTPANLCLFDSLPIILRLEVLHFPVLLRQACCVAVRSIGGVMTLINKILHKNTETIYSDERFVIVKLVLTRNTNCVGIKLISLYWHHRLSVISITRYKLVRLA